MKVSTAGPARIAGFLLVLAAAFSAALGVGNAVGPVRGVSGPTSEGPAARPHGSSGHGGEEVTATGASEARTVHAVPGGLAMSEAGYQLRLEDSHVDRGHDTAVAFTVTGPAGRPVTSYDVQHEKALHFIAVRRDLTGFQHVHPEMATDGTWHTRLDLTPGTWRVFADFKPSGAQPLTLGSDLHVAGNYHPGPRTTDSRSFDVGAYTVTLDGELKAGADSKLTLSVFKDGSPVRDLQPYLGAYGHLVALRAGDLAYLHVHPLGHVDGGTTQAGPEVVFSAEVPSTGRYHLFLDFKHDGVVRTAEFALSTSGSADGLHDEAAEGGAAHEHD